MSTCFRFRLAPFAVVITLAACGGDEVAPGIDSGGVDGGTVDGSRIDGGRDASALCAVDRDCRDDLFCTGSETCRPGVSGADERGCVPGVAPCDATETCDESADVCEALACADADSDGVPDAACGGTDCDDTDSTRYPGATEVCDGVGHDEDCDASTFGMLDLDADGHTAVTCCNGSICGDDCDDTAPGISPTATETCNGLDDDCDGAADEGVLAMVFLDMDGDGFGVGPLVVRCPGTTGFAGVAGDCDDTAPTISPAATELCSNGVDDDCDGMTDESGPRLFFRDADGDGYGDPGDTTMTASCTPPSGYTDNSRDCADGSAAVHPGAIDLCNGLDDDCSIPGSGGIELSEDRDGDGHSPASASCTGGNPKDDCLDSRADTFPGATELCDGRDNDCSVTASPGGFDSSEDLDGDLHSPPTAACAGGFPTNDCDDTRPTIHGGALELCDRLDNDCSSGGGVALAEDLDSDGHAPVTTACMGGPLPEDDCDDTRVAVHPGAPELCDRLDTDCSSGGGVLAAEDADRDLHTAISYVACSGGYAGDDCDDARVTVYPGAPELCDRLDTDCSSGGGAVIAEDVDGDSHTATTYGACTGGPLLRDDCDDSRSEVRPGAAELCDRLDTDCSSGGGAVIAEDVDGDLHTATGYGACNGGYPRDDCDDGRATIYLGALELCDRLDTDCSAGGGTVIAEDVDGDLHTATGYGACSGGYPSDDCDDANAAIYPGGTALPAPGLLGPQNGALTGSFRAPGMLRPTFQWRPPSCEAPAAYEIAVDDSCATADFVDCAFPSPELTQSGITATSFRPASDLPVSAVAPVGRRYFWRVRSCEGATCGSWSSVRYLDVGRVSSDVNGDGYADLIVGAPYQDAGAIDEGSAFVYLGSTTGAPTAPSITLDNPANQAAGLFGHSVASAGDLNADGYADLVIGASAQDAGATDEGNAFVYLGSATGVPTLPAITLDNPANQMSGSFGRSVAGTGDVNGDGYADLVVGARAQDAGAIDEGNAFLYLGSATGVAGGPSVTFDNPANQASAYFGASVAAAGDLNGDGYADLVVGAFLQDSGSADEGNAFVYLGNAAGGAALPSITLDNPVNQAAGNFGSSVAPAGDVNGDGYADLVVGAYVQDAGASNEGNAFVYFGSSAGVALAPSITLDNPANQVAGLFGVSTGSAGDLNGDGYGDLVVGAYGQDAPASNEGNAFVYFGSATGLPVAPSITLDNPANQDSGNFGVSVASGDLNGDGYADLVVGAHQQSASASYVGSVFTYVGSTAGLLPAPSITINNPAPEVFGNFGYSVASR